MMNVPFSVISGISPKKTSCSLMSRTLLTFDDVVLQLQAHRVAAFVAERDDVLVERAALVAQHIARMKRIGFDGGAAAWIAASRAQVVQAFQVAALALPVANRVIDEF